MEAMDSPGGNAADRDALLERAAGAGFELTTREIDTGQVVWEWRRGAGPAPQFVSERVARHWMFEWLDQFNVQSSVA